MVAGCGNKFVKFVFVFFNLLLFIFGALILGLSLWVRFDNEFQRRMGDNLAELNMNDINLNQMYLVLYLLMVVGAILFATGFLGCCGACTEQLCILGLFFTVVLALFCLEIGAIIFVYVRKDTIEMDFINWYKTEIVGKYNSSNDLGKQLDVMHLQLSCCGARGCSDFSIPPDSCNCQLQPNQKVWLVFLIVLIVVGNGCAEKLVEAISNDLLIVGVNCLVVLAIELFGMIFACILCSAIKTDRSYDYY